MADTMSQLGGGASIDIRPSHDYVALLTCRDELLSAEGKLTAAHVTEYLNGLEIAARSYYKGLPRKERRAEVRAAVKRAKRAIRAARAAADV